MTVKFIASLESALQVRAAGDDWVSRTLFHMLSVNGAKPHKDD
jgi:hypothetical protein